MKRNAILLIALIVLAGAWSAADVYQRAEANRLAAAQVATTQEQDPQERRY